MSQMYRVSFPGSVRELVDISSIICTMIQKKHRCLRICVAWLKRPSKVDDVEDIWKTERRGVASKRDWHGGLNAPARAQQRT